MPLSWEQQFDLCWKYESLIEFNKKINSGQFNSKKTLPEQFDVLRYQ